MESICVFCGASPGADPEYRRQAYAMGRELAERGIRLVYGGGSCGLMGALADGCREGGGEVVGVITRQLEKLELGHSKISRLEVVDTMHQRKARMEQLASGFVALPGGIGTLEEIFEALTWAQLRIHAKPCGFLNVAGYFDHLIGFLDRVVQERFLLVEHADMMIVDREIPSLLDRMRGFQAVHPENWLERKVAGAG